MLPKTNPLRWNSASDKPLKMMFCSRHKPLNPFKAYSNLSSDLCSSEKPTNTDTQWWPRCLDWGDSSVRPIFMLVLWSLTVIFLWQQQTAICCFLIVSVLSLYRPTFCPCPGTLPTLTIHAHHHSPHDTTSTSPPPAPTPLPPPSLPTTEHW